LNPKELEKKYQLNKEKFHTYINSIKKNMKVDIFSIINTTIISNPYTTDFPKKFFSQSYDNENKFLLFIKSSFKFYLKQFYLLFSYIVAFIIYKIIYKKQCRVDDKKIGIDIFFLVDNINKDGKFNENYFKGVYEVLEKYNQKYIFIPRLYGVGKNPFKLVQFFKVLNGDEREFLFEFELLSIIDFFRMFFLILQYPFKVLRLIQNEVKGIDKLFNNEIFRDISKQQFDAFSRYIYGKNIAKLKPINKIYSWSEFQVVDRSFNYGIRKNNDKISLIACQFYLNYETYFNAYVNDLDFDMLSSPHKVLVNGKYYILDREKVFYEEGVALRYNNIFSFDGIKKEKNILLLGSYIEKDTKYMLESIDQLDSVIFKNHPAVNIDNLGHISSNIKVSNENIYKLFENTKLAIGTASGTSVEAVACGISVIIIASKDNLTANPLIDYGKGKIWDIAFNEDDVKRLYNTLIEYRKNNQDEIRQIARWYKENFFIEPTEENIVKAFDLDGEICR